MSTTKGRKGYAAIGLRELDENEIKKYCTNTNITITEPPSSSTGSRNRTFISDYSVRMITSGCYYLDLQTGLWSTNGVEIMRDSTLFKTHCISYHLTSFAGGFIVLPAKIDFNEVFAKASFMDNPTIYITVIVISSAYIIFALMTIYSDRKDKKRIGFTLLDFTDHENYFYEVILFTGSRRNAETDSKVC